MSKPRKYPMPDYKVPEGMVIVGYMSREGRLYYRYAEAAEFNAKPRWRLCDGKYQCFADEPPLPVEAAYAFVNGKDCLNT